MVICKTINSCLDFFSGASKVRFTIHTKIGNRILKLTCELLMFNILGFYNVDDKLFELLKPVI